MHAKEFLYQYNSRTTAVKLSAERTSTLLHCVERVQIQCFFWSLFSRIWTEYRDLRSKYLYSVQVRENTDQKKLRIWTPFAQC